MLRIYLYFCAAVSVLTIIFFAWDKISSMQQKSKRIPESVLLSFIAAGGAVGGLIGMYVFRHKTSFATKFQFGIGLWVSLILQICVGAFIYLFKNGYVIL